MGAEFSDCRKYRYTLTREFGDYGKEVVFIGLNPSTADEARDDPTIRRCISFARKLDGSRLHMLNLYAFRATKPADLWLADDPIGPDNDWHIRKVLRRSDIVVCAWGVNAKYERAKQVLDLIEEPFCLGLTAAGFPRHPLYVRGSQHLVPYANLY